VTLDKKMLESMYRAWDQTEVYRSRYPENSVRLELADVATPSLEGESAGVAIASAMWAAYDDGTTGSLDPAKTVSAALPDRVGGPPKPVKHLDEKLAAAARPYANLTELLVAAEQLKEADDAKSQLPNCQVTITPIDSVRAAHDRLCQHHSPGPNGHKPRTPRPVPQSYRNWLQKQCADIDLLGLKSNEGQAVRINNVYVPLTTQAADQKDDPGVDRSDPRIAEREQKPRLLLDFLDKHSLYVPGAAGSGKSTLCRWVTYLACAGELPKHEVAAPNEYREAYQAVFQNRRRRLYPSPARQSPGIAGILEGATSKHLPRRN
jgi:hypothetical protein